MRKIILILLCTIIAFTQAGCRVVSDDSRYSYSYPKAGSGSSSSSAINQKHKVIWKDNTNSFTSSSDLKKNPNNFIKIYKASFADDTATESYSTASPKTISLSFPVANGPKGKIQIDKLVVRNTGLPITIRKVVFADGNIVDELNKLFIAPNEIMHDSWLASFTLPYTLQNKEYYFPIVIEKIDNKYFSTIVKIRVIYTTEYGVNSEFVFTIIDKLYEPQLNEYKNILNLSTDEESSCSEIHQAYRKLYKQGIHPDQNNNNTASNDKATRINVARDELLKAYQCKGNSTQKDAP